VGKGDRVVATRTISTGGFFSSGIPEDTEGTILAVKDGGLFGNLSYVVKWDGGYGVVEAPYDAVHPL
jgi:hypothetical protein